jgi:hypothetical protein
MRPLCHLAECLRSYLPAIVILNEIITSINLDLDAECYGTGGEQVKYEINVAAAGRCYFGLVVFIIRSFLRNTEG